MCDTEKSVSLPTNTKFIWNKAFINVFIVNSIMNMGTFMANSLVQKYADFLGAGATIVGVISGIFAVTALGIRPVAGPAIDYFRKSRLFSLAIAIIAFAFIGYGCANNITMIMIARLLQGLGMGFTGPLSLALASEALPPSKMASGIGILTLGQAVATAIGPFIGLKLADLIGYNLTFFISAAVTGCSAVWSFCLPTDPPARTERFKISVDRIIAFQVIIPAIIMFFLGGAYACLSSFIVIYGGLRSIANIGLFFTAYAVCLLFSRPIAGRIADKYGLDKTIIPGTLIFGISFIIISFARSLPVFLLTGAFSALGYGACQPSIQALCMQLVPKERRGAAGNTNYMGVDGGNLVLPALAGMIISNVQKNGGSEISGYAVMFRIMGIPILLALGIFLLKRKELLEKAKSSIENP